MPEALSSARTMSELSMQMGHLRRKHGSLGKPAMAIHFLSLVALVMTTSCCCVSPADGFFAQSNQRPTRIASFAPFDLRIPPSCHKRTEGRFLTCLWQAAGGSGGEKTEWRAILASFQLYKAAYGDLKIPIRFVVPSMKPWPGEYFRYHVVLYAK